MIVAFKYVAKHIHIMYGHTKYAAALFIKRNARAMYIDTTINIINTNNANAAICNPKNTYVHKKFKAICPIKSQYAFDLLMRLFFSFIIKNNAIPNSKYNIVHATLNTQPDGVNIDLDNSLYHIFDGPCGVNSTPIIPGINETMIAKIKVKNFLMIKTPFLFQYRDILARCL